MKTFSILVVLGCMNSPSLEKSLNGWTSDGHHLQFHLSQAMRLSASGKLRRLSSRSDPQDAAVATILGGDYAAGIVMLKELEARKPDDYNTAANLGTAYELAGDNEKALEWIKEGIQRNSRSHQGTEWLHTVILEAKLAAAKGEGLPETTRLVSLPDTVDKSATLVIQGANHKVAEVFAALAYQLEERMVFVKPKDRWVAECLYSLAILQAHLYSVEDALGILGLAEQYGFPDGKLLKSKRQSLERSIWIGKAQHWCVIVIGSVVGILAILFCYRKLAELLSA